MTELFTPRLTPGTPLPEPVEVRVRRAAQNLETLQTELALSSHRYSVQNTAPLVLQRFFTGEIDLDIELGKRFNGSPLLSRITFPPGETAQSMRGTARMMTQDDHAALTVDLDRFTGMLELTFTLEAMLALRFELSGLDDVVRRRWLDLMRREQGIAFLWSPARWERDYMIFVVRKYDIRAYAFSPRRFEAAVRLTPDVLTAFLDWLEAYWF